MLVISNKYNNRATFLKTLRLSFLDKLNLQNTYKVMGVSATVMFDLKNLEDFDSTRLVASMFAARLLTGCKPYVSRFGLFQTFREKDYDVVVQVEVRGWALFEFLGVLAYEILPFVAKADCKSSILGGGEGIVVLFAISDLSSIRVIETHFIFFKWHDTIKVRLCFTTSEITEVDAFLSAFKVNWRPFLVRNVV